MGQMKACPECREEQPEENTYCVKCGVSMSGSGGKGLSTPRTVRSLSYEVVSWVVALFLSFVGVGIGANNGMLDFIAFVISIVALVFGVVVLFSPLDRTAKVNGVLRPAVVLLMVAVFWAAHTAKVKATMDFVRQTAQQVERVCKENKTCPDKIEGFVCDGNASRSTCSGSRNDFPISYERYHDMDEGTANSLFRFQVKLGGYTRFSVTGGVQKQIEQRYSAGS